MTIYIIIANLPPEASPEDVKARFLTQGVDGGVTFYREGDPSKVTAIIESDHLRRVAAEQIAFRINGMFFMGRHLQSYVPLFL
jgi:hypothetical protein